MNLLQLFDLSFRGRSGAHAIEFETLAGIPGRASFGEVNARANRMARALAHLGFQRGDRLCLQLPNCMEMIDLYLACLKLGVIFVPVNVLYKDRETSHIVSDAEPRKFLIASDVPALNDLAARQTDEELRAPLDGDAPAGIIYTSGTTGVSKGAVLTHHNFASNAVNLLTCWQITSRDRLLMPLPLFHVHGLGNALHCWLAAGPTMRLLERFEHARALEQFRAFEPTLFFGVPTMYVRLLEWPEDAARDIGSRMRLFVSGSAPLPAHVLEEFRTRFGQTILERYGMTETIMNTGNPYEGERRPGTVGFPFPGVSVQVRDAEGRVLADNESGELFVRGPNVFSGYWRRPEATAAAFTSDGYFRTGDVGMRDSDGYYMLQARKSDLIISGGFNIYPREIEEFLLEHEGVREAAVVGLPDRVRGEVPVAYVVCAADVDLPALEERCRASLASFKVPRRFHQVDSLPRNAMGKVQKHLLPR